MATNLGQKSAKSAYSPSFVAMVFRNGLEYRNAIGGATPKFMGGPNLRLYDRRYTRDLWPITHNSGDRHKSCVM